MATTSVLLCGPNARRPLLLGLGFVLRLHLQLNMVSVQIHACADLLRKLYL